MNVSFPVPTRYCLANRRLRSPESRCSCVRFSLALTRSPCFAISNTIRSHDSDHRSASQVASTRAETRAPRFSNDRRRVDDWLGHFHRFCRIFPPRRRAWVAACCLGSRRRADDHGLVDDTVLIIDSAVRRSLRSSQFNQRRVECAEALRLLRHHWPSFTNLAAAEPEPVLAAGLPHPLDRRALHVSRETRRVRDAVSLLRAGQPLTHELLVGSHDSLRDLYECSCPELDWLVQRAITLPGVRGARLTGAGWGGCVIVVGDNDELEGAQLELALDYRSQFNRTPRLWRSRAAPGTLIEHV